MKGGISNVEAPRDLPHELVAHHILTRLPIKPLVKFKSVSKQWYSTLSSSQFAHIYSKLSLSSNPSSPIQYLIIQNGNKFYLLSHDDNDVDDIGTRTFDVNKILFELKINFDAILDENLFLIGSCNGLVCLASLSGYFFILWNPITGEFRKHSDLDLLTDSSPPVRVSWGFGYVSSVDDFKVVRVLEMRDTREFRVHVFSLKFNKWTKIADELYRDIFLRTHMVGTPSLSRQLTYYNMNFLKFPTFRGVLVNETLYWIELKANGYGRKIVAYDLASEVFYGDVNLKVIDTEVYSDDFLCDMGGCLTTCGHKKCNDVSIRMLKCPGKVETICLCRDLTVISCKDLVGFTRTGKFFIQLGDSVVGLVDPSSEPMKYTELVSFERSESTCSEFCNMLRCFNTATCSKTCKIASFVPSLTLPYAAEELSGKHNAC